MNKLKGDLSPNYVMKYFLKRKHQGFNILIQGCQNAPATGAIAGYSEVFTGCKLLEKREK